MAQYSALRCVSGIWQNSEKPLISNGLRFIFTCLLTGALWVLFHCARHSFAVNLLGECHTDIKTVASLLGHSGLKHTEKYTRAVDSLKEKAVNALPELVI